jgi:hypothetical protein
VALIVGYAQGFIRKWILNVPVVLERILKTDILPVLMLIVVLRKINWKYAVYVMTFPV